MKGKINGNGRLLGTALPKPFGNFTESLNADL